MLSESMVSSSDNSLEAIELLVGEDVGSLTSTAFIRKETGGRTSQLHRPYTRIPRRDPPPAPAPRAAPPAARDNSQLGTHNDRAESGDTANESSSGGSICRSRRLTRRPRSDPAAVRRHCAQSATGTFGDQVSVAQRRLEAGPLARSPTSGDENPRRLRSSAHRASQGVTDT